MTEALDIGDIEVVLFDSYGTLLDTGTAAGVLEDIVDDPEAVATRWRGNALFYSVVANDLDQYRTYFQLHADGLRDALEAEGIDLSEDRIRELNSVYHDLDPFEDVEDGFGRLAAGGYRPSICSNGTPEMLDSLVASANIGDSVSELVSAHDIRTFKPSAEIYQHAASRVDTEPERIAHVSAHWMDVQGAMNAGLYGVYLDREGIGSGWPSFGPSPTRSVDSIDSLCTVLGV